jgi:anti-sigma28 factor (negative regulator of flagellin synthesis)
MKIIDVRQVGSVGPSPQLDSAKGAQQKPAADRVEAAATRAVQEAITKAQISSNTSRSARLRQIEALVKSGAYRPDPAQIAEQILDAAEIDANLLALLR